MFKSIYFFNNVISGIIAGIFAPCLMFIHLAKNPSKNLLKLVLFFSMLFFIVHMIIGITGSLFWATIVYFTPWVILSIKNDFSMMDSEKERKETNEESSEW